MAAPMEGNIVNVIKEKATLCLESRKQINNVVDIISHMDSEKRDVLTACINALQRIFEKFISTEEMCGSSSDEKSKVADKEAEYREWLRQQYTATVACLLDKLTCTDRHIQKLSLRVLMMFVAAEGRHPITTKSSSHAQLFPESLFAEIMTHFLSSDESAVLLLESFQDFLQYDDVRYQTLQCIHKHLQKNSSKALTDIYMTNVFGLLDKCSSLKCKTKSLRFFAVDTAGKMGSSKEHTKLFTSTWLKFLSCKLTASLYKKVLIIAKDKVMPRLSNPLVLSDFLTESYTVGGVISLLALDGLFLLINKHNLEYPDFYEKLYALLEPAVFHVKYRARFFHLTDLFLTSTHLPSYLVAAFAKKMSRISLTAPAPVLKAAIVFVCNLLKRHPTCKVLINRPDAPTDLDADPFLYDEPDPAKCEALKSSLWEIKSLQNHYCPEVVKLATRINLPLHHTEDMLSDFLEVTEDELIQREIKRCRKTMKTTPVTFAPPKGLFGNKSDRLKMHWLLE
ncbi:nucleolar complex protein 4 homolog A-like isoform X1 [Haliotis cracherodii]|uniref:nucleolar complex protein 4 homolog A-like isoform X1 n=1 Tax=Haliotis cracherodii TaxID=6455 RepID=UPI0039EC64C7